MKLKEHLGNVTYAAVCRPVSVRVRPEILL